MPDRVNVPVEAQTAIRQATTGSGAGAVSITDYRAPLHPGTAGHVVKFAYSKTVLRVFFGMALLAMLAAFAALGISIHNMSSRTFKSIKAEHITVTASTDRPEGILVLMEGKDSAYQSGAAGIRVDMPAQHSIGSSQQAGLVVQGGQYGVESKTPQTAGVVVSNPANYAYSVQGGVVGSLLANNNTGVE